MKKINFDLYSAHFKNTRFLTGLRAYAALAVFLIHSGGAGLRELAASNTILSNFLNKFVDFGKYGVVIFFVLSAYTISFSLDSSKNFNYKKYFIKRLCRILPMYYLIITIAFIYGGIPDYFRQFNVENSWHNLVAHLTFANLFLIQYRNNLIGVEWSIPIELFYYLFVPAALVLFEKIKNFSSILFLISVLCMYLGPQLLNFDYSEFRGIAYHWSLVKYIFSFSVGLILYQYIKMNKNNFFENSTTIFLGLFLVLACIINQNAMFNEELIAIWTAALIVVINARSKLSVLLFENRLAVTLGTVSYSFYLIHYPILTLLEKYKLSSFFQFTTAFFITFILSYLAYVFIEQPFMTYGKNYGKNHD